MDPARDRAPILQRDRDPRDALGRVAVGKLRIGDRLDPAGEVADGLVAERRTDDLIGGQTPAHQEGGEHER